MRIFGWGLIHRVFDSGFVYEEVVAFKVAKLEQVLLDHGGNQCAFVFYVSDSPIPQMHFRAALACLRQGKVLQRRPILDRSQLLPALRRLQLHPAAHQVFYQNFTLSFSFCTKIII